MKTLVFFCLLLFLCSCGPHKDIKNYYLAEIFASVHQNDSLIATIDDFDFPKEYFFDKKDDKNALYRNLKKGDTALAYYYKVGSSNKEIDFGIFDVQNCDSGFISQMENLLCANNKFDTIIKYDPESFLFVNKKYSYSLKYNPAHKNINIWFKTID